MSSRGVFCISCGHHFVLVSGAVGSGFCHFSFSLILGCGEGVVLGISCLRFIYFCYWFGGLGIAAGSKLCCSWVSVFGRQFESMTLCQKCHGSVMLLTVSCYRVGVLFDL